MKKQSIFSTVMFIAALVFASCSKFEPAKVKLANENDSLNYVLGLANGDGIKNYYLRGDSTDKPIKELLSAMDKAFNDKSAKKDELYQLGLQIGNSLKQQKEIGLMGDSTLAFNQKLVMQGLINGLNGFKEGMSTTQADEYLRKVMTELQEKRMKAQTPQPAPQSAPADTVSEADNKK